MSVNYIINFVDENGNNFDTVSGKNAKFLMKYSELLRTLHEIDPNERIFTVPVKMPYGRQELFQKILKGYPVAEWRENTYANTYTAWFKPVSDEEEEIIADQIKKGIASDVQEERIKAVFDTLSFLMMDPWAEDRMITIEYPKNENARERMRRHAITHKRRDNTFRRIAPNAYHNTNNYGLEQNVIEKTIPFLNEDTIEDLIEKHKDLLYRILRPRYYSTVRLNKLMNEKDIAVRNKQWEAYKKRKENERKTRRQHMRYNNNYHYRYYYNNNNNNNNDLYNVERLEEYFKPFPVDVSKMSSREFERYLRSLRREGEEKYLPYQGPLVGNLFGNQSNV